jgi:hypothetical protein
MNTRWLEGLLRPLVVGTMVGCVALSVVQVIRLFVPGWSAAFFFVACVLAAIEAHYSHQLIQSRSQYHTDVWRFRAVELGTLFILIKIGSYIGVPWPDVVMDVQLWGYEIARIFDPKSVSAFILAFLSWLVSTQTSRDLERLDEPSDFHRAESPPMVTLTKRFFWGGGVLLVLSGVGHIGLTQLLNLRRPPVSGLIVNVLVYYTLGLFMLGQVRYVTLRKAWRELKVEIPMGLVGQWVRYSLVFLALAASLAFLLPTQYTIGLLDAAMRVIRIAFLIISFIYTLLLFLISLPLWLLSRLFGGARRQAPVPPMVPWSAPPLAEQRTGPGWFAVVQTVVFWIVAVGVVSFVIWSYLRDHPEIWRALTSSALIRMLRALWRALRQQFVRWRTTARSYLRRQAAGERGAEMPGRIRRSWFGVRTLRERVLYHYLGVLRRAKRRGFPRRPAETPIEYEAELVPRLPDAQAEMDLITDAFVEARYSQHPVVRVQVAQVREWGQRVKAALREVRLRRRSGGWRAGRSG